MQLSRADVIGHSTARTIPALFRERVARSPDAIAYREWDDAIRRWQDYSWRDMAGLVRRYQAALCGATLEEGDRVAILLPNGTDWVALDIAAMASGLMTVPIYSHDSLANASHILTNSGARLMVLDTWEQWAALAPWSVRFPALRHVWVRQARTANAPEASAGPTVTPLADALSSRTEAMRELALAADATATLIYTSGTTGPPKGVMLSHFAILWNCEAATRFIAPLPQRRVPVVPAAGTCVRADARLRPAHDGRRDGHLCAIGRHPARGPRHHPPDGSPGGAAHLRAH